MSKKKKETVDSRIVDRLNNLRDFERRLSMQLASVQGTIRELEALLGEEYYADALDPATPPFPPARPVPAEIESKE